MMPHCLSCPLSLQTPRRPFDEGMRCPRSSRDLDSVVRSGKGFDMLRDKTIGEERVGTVFNFLAGLVMLSTLAFISGCLLERGTIAQAHSRVIPPTNSPLAEPQGDSPIDPPPSLSMVHSPPPSINAPDASELARRNQAIDLSARYLVDQCQADGQFVYRINLDPNVSYPPRYNILRHCGTMYALGMYYDWQPDAQVRQTLKRSCEFLIRRTVANLPGHDDLAAIWSRPEIAHADAPLQAKLGGTGLGLVALTTTESIIPDSVPIETMRRLGRFILHMQKPDGSFHSKYIPSRGGRQDNWTSLYYPGEAALGLLMLHEFDPDERWIRGAVEALGYLARSRKGLDQVPADHWALLATARLLSTSDVSSIDVDRDLLIAHAIQISESIMDEQVIETDSPALLGGFTLEGRTTPTATRMEGLLAMLDILPEDQVERRAKLRASIDLGMFFLNNAQVRSGDHAGAIPRAVRPWPDDGSSDVRAFNRRVNEVRIDYVQHAMCAMIQYVQSLSARTETAVHPDSE